MGQNMVILTYFKLFEFRDFSDVWIFLYKKLNESKLWGIGIDLSGISLELAIWHTKIYVQWNCFSIVKNKLSKVVCVSKWFDVVRCCNDIDEPLCGDFCVMWSDVEICVHPFISSLKIEV